MNDHAPSVLRSSSRALTSSGQMGSLLVDSGKLTEEEVALIVQLQDRKGLRFGEAAVALGLLRKEEVNSVLAQQFSYPVALRADRQLSPALAAAFRPQSRRVEAMRGLRSELMLRYFDETGRRILPLISVDGGLAAGEFAANLAIVFAQLGAKTLLIDANLRNPSLHKLFSLPNRHGLSDILAGRTTIAKPEQCQPIDSLWLFNGGSVAPNPQELVAHARYRRLTNQLEEEFDVILINTPSLRDNLDAQIIANRAGAALLIARENVTSMHRLDQVSRRLQDVGVALLGVALSQ